MLSPLADNHSYQKEHSDMADEKTENKTVDLSKDDEAFSASFGGDGKPTFSTGSGIGDTEFTPEREPKEGEDGEEPEVDLTADEEKPEGEADKAKAEEPEAETPAAIDPLPDFKADDEVVLKAYEERYVREDGTPDEDALGAVVYANSKKEGGKPELNEGDYAFLKEKFKLSREMVDSHIAGKIALASKQADSFYSTVGGKETWDSMREWAKTGYTQAQKDRANAAFKKGGEEALEAIELLQTRFKAAGGTVPEKTKVEEKPEAEKPARQSSPKKTASSAHVAGGAAALTPYESYEAYRQDLRAAGSNTAKAAAVRARLAASPAIWR